MRGDAHAGTTVKHRSPRSPRDPDQPNLRQVHLIHRQLFDQLTAAAAPSRPVSWGENARDPPASTCSASP